MNQAWEGRWRRRTVRHWGCVWSFMSSSNIAVESKVLLYCHNFFFSFQKCWYSSKSLYQGPHHIMGLEKKKNRNPGEVMLVTSNHQPVADHVVKQARAMASFGSVPIEGAVIHVWCLQNSSVFNDVWILGFGIVFSFGPLWSYFQRKAIIQNDSIY